jgi:hypothetical protein
VPAAHRTGPAAVDRLRPSSAFLDDAVGASDEQASHSAAAFRPIAAQKRAPRAQGPPGSLGWLTAGEVAERLGVVTCKPSESCGRGVRRARKRATPRISCVAANGKRQTGNAPASASKHHDGGVNARAHV